MGFQNPIVGGTALRIPAIQSPNYTPGVSGWIVKINGDAEFNNLTVRGEFHGTNFVINSSGAFFYDPTPAAGNLVASIAAADGTDAYGNTYLGGIVTYSGSTFASLNVGNVLLGVIADAVNAAVVGLSGSDGLFLSSPVSGSNTDTSTLDLLDGQRSVTPTSAAGFPHMLMDGTGWVRDALIAATDNGNVWTPETWQYVGTTPGAATFNANWSGTSVFGTIAGGLSALAYRRDNEDNLWVRGVFKAATGAGTAVTNFPSAYRPKVENGGFPVAFISSGGTAGNAWMYVSMAGNLNLNSQLGISAATNGTAYYVNGKIPLGNVG